MIQRKKAKYFINKAIKEECYWGTGGIRTFWESDLLDETNKIYYNCGKDYGRLKYGNGKCAKENNIKTINWQIKEDIKMEKTFREVIADIKEGEVWKSEFCTIEATEYDTKIRMGNASNIAIGTNVKFKLKRKQYTFTEAFKAYEEGKEIESCVTRDRYLWNGITDLIKKETHAEFHKLKSIDIDEIRGEWYINN